SAMVYPTGPAPITMTSYTFSAAGPLMGRASTGPGRSTSSRPTTKSGQASRGHDAALTCENAALPVKASRSGVHLRGNAHARRVRGTGRGGEGYLRKVPGPA